MPTAPLDDRALQAEERSAPHTDAMPGVEPRLRRERNTRVDETLDRAEVVQKDRLVADGEPAGDRVGGQRQAALIVVDIAPVAYPDQHTPIIDAMLALPLENVRRRQDVERALVDVVAAHGVRSTDQAIAFVADLKKQGRYQQDVY